MFSDVKMDFIQKSHFVAIGLRTQNPEESKYAGSVSCDSICIALTYATLCGLKVMLGDILNAHSQASTSEKF